MSACWLLAIKEGSIENVACPSIECVKKRAKRDAANRPSDTPVVIDVKIDQVPASTGEVEVELELVEKVVGREMSERLKWLREKRRVENGMSWWLGNISALIAHIQLYRSILHYLSTPTLPISGPRSTPLQTPRTPLRHVKETRLPPRTHEDRRTGRCAKREGEAGEGV